MFCTNCGKEISKDLKFCPYCGTPVSVPGSAAARPVQGAGAAQLPDLITRAKTGDQAALTALYERSYSKAYYTVKAMIKNEDDVFDVLQDTYVKAFSHLNGFTGSEANFTPWVKQIAANTARDWLKKKRPMLFSEMGTDEELPAEEFFAEERAERLPEVALDQAETVRLIREIIEELPEDQRAAIGMYYYEDMSVREIAQAMGATENAVKSRLMYGRRKIEKKVSELEQKGTKLYGLAPILFLLLLFRGSKAQAAAAPAGALLQKVLTQTGMNAAKAGSGAAQSAAASQAARTAGQMAGAAAGKTAAGLSAAKLAIIIGASVLVIGGTVGGIVIANNAKRKQQEAQAILGGMFITNPHQNTIGRAEEPVQRLDTFVVSGTIDTYTYDEVVELQGEPDPNEAYKEYIENNTWRILVLDAPQKLPGHKLDEEVE